MVSKKELRSTYDEQMMCPNDCGARYSANKNDYYTVGNDYVFTCDECEEPLILVRKVVTYERL
jgi:hypothetical protein|tara:strand:+ start:376 stop:564 length:189 start_codon:yes stop_codon:yes gene_type:complete